ncbi:MAG TPA: hypothetical protein VEV43_04125 [Actinomycetota bacterium]|nr:hypothetical protein [Actinomycetota bacterium]
MDNSNIRELFIDELSQVTGGADPLERVKQIVADIKDGWETTQACCEEGQCCDYWS